MRFLVHRHLGPDAMYDYDLFSVVCHEGQIDNGHYTCFARSHDEVRTAHTILLSVTNLVCLCLGNQWYRFDDDK